MEQASRYLSIEQAQHRFSQIDQGSISYNLYLQLKQGTNYQANLNVQFSVKHLDTDLFIDFMNKSIQQLIINQRVIEKIQWDGLFIIFPKEYLKIGQNTVQIFVQCEYRNDGSGLHSFTDTDGQQYLYSQGEAFLNNRFFPLFDQPDLKAYLTLSVLAPKNWIVLSNEKPIKVQAMNMENFDFYSFPKTKLLSSYLFALAAGPYKEIVNPHPYKGIPMSLFCRSSLHQYLEKLAEFIFEVTDGAMNMYENYFGYPYPFSKYDQIYCPEYNMGAMENAGLVTFNDDYIYKEEVDSGEYTWLTNVITHELSHHWFGNLVTMKWWNDLWLNESFADYISHYCMTKFVIRTKPIQDVWLSFNANKSSGYRADQLITTHPIAGDVPNTEAAESIFDGITYSKGASTLKQLMALIGEEAFGDAMKKYFKKYEYKNATLDDFINCMNDEFQKINKDFTLQEWKQEWICKAGLNECQPLFNPNDNSPQAKLIVKQTVALPQHPTLRRHKMKVAFFDANANITEQAILLQPQEQTQIVYDGTQQFKAVLLNYADQAFIKVLLDDNSIEFFKQNLFKIKDVLTRTLIWRAFFDMLRDGKLSSEEYADIFISQLPLETSDDIITNQYLFVSATQRYTPLKYESELNNRIFDFTVKYIQQIPPENNNRILAVKSNLTFFAKTDEKIDILLQWYRGNYPPLKNFEPGLQIEWDIVSKIFQSKKYSLQEKEQLLAEQKKKDQSDTSVNMDYKCKALVSSLAEKEELWKSYLDPANKLSVRNLQFSMSGFNNQNCIDELKPFYDKWFQSLTEVFKQRQKDYAVSFYTKLFPHNFDLDYIIKGLSEIDKNCDQSLFMLKKKVQEGLDDTLRVKNAWECFMKRAKMAKM